MSRACNISGKKAQVGNKVSHANNKRKRVYEVNLQNKRLFDSETNQWLRLRLSSRMLRTVDKLGLSATLRKFGLKSH
ncbi:MAG: 50S ribosomal protein L28 [Deltaproteobacteria bacterium]|nr:50S ribosomal protein L28 [Deltaproteobacteria bacterium]